MSSTSESADVFEELKQPNQLDPGPPLRRKAKTKLRRRCKCAVYTVLILLGIGAAWGAFRAIKTHHEPYAFLYQDPKESYRPQDVVRPLIDRNQTFDIVATVWLRSPPKDESGQYVDWYQNFREPWIKQRQMLTLRETAIFSDVVFKGLRLQDKNNRTSVNIQVPTEVFKLRELRNYDLRASFVLIPNSPSLLDKASSFSSWIPAEARHPPMRFWPSSTLGPSLTDKIADSYGVFTPLLAFQDIKSKCPGSATLEEPEEEDVVFNDGVLPLSIAEARKNWVSTKGKPVLSSHPYIITRSFLRVVDMTKIFNKHAFDNEHAKLQAFSCRRLFSGLASWTDCFRSYYAIGNHAVQIRLNQTSDETGKELTEWAYAPYLSVAQTWAPKDLVPVPVEREKCLGGESTEESEVSETASVNITWSIAFSGMSLFELNFGDAISMAMPSHNMNATEHVQVLENTFREYGQGLAGDWVSDDFHPRRELALCTVNDICHAIMVLLNILYWFNRWSTSGISIIGTTVQISLTALTSFAMITFQVLQGEHLGVADNIRYVYMIVNLFTASLMLKAITRAEIRWWKKVIPTIIRVPATHSERTSQRIEARTPYRFVAIAYVVLSSLFYILHLQEYHIIAPRFLYGGTFKSQLCRFLFWSQQYLLRYPLGVIGPALQLILNYRLKTFGGMYKVTVGVTLAALISGFASKAPWIIGESKNAWPWTFFDLFQMLCYCAYAFQAYAYVSAASLDEDEDME